MLTPLIMLAFVLFVLWVLFRDLSDHRPTPEHPTRPFLCKVIGHHPGPWVQRTDGGNGAHRFCTRCGSCREARMTVRVFPAIGDPDY